MKRALQIIAAVLYLGAVAFWAATGAHRGFTQNQEQIKTIDPVTGLDVIQWKDHFVPGIDFLAVACFVTMVLVGVSFLFRNKKTGTQNQPQL